MPKHRELKPKSFVEKPTPGICRWCAEPTFDKQGNPGKRWWHDKCVTEYLLANSSSEQRKVCKKRDKEICAECGLNCKKARLQAIGQHELDKWLLTRHMWSLGILRTCHSYHMNSKYAENQFAQIRLERGWPKNVGGTWWNADHKVALCNANGDRSAFGINNLQTLCHLCHKNKTKLDVAEMKRRKKEDDSGQKAFN